MPPWYEMSARQIASYLSSGQVSSEEVTSALLERIDRYDGLIGSLITVDPEGAIAAARAADGRRRAGVPRSGLDGVPVTVKDLLDTAGLRTTHGSRSFADFRPETDDIVVRRLRNAGLVILGKANTPELGTLPETYGAVQPRCANPWDRARTSGGSSGGPA